MDATGFDLSSFLTKHGVGRRVLEIKPREAVFSQGEAAESVFYINKGRAKLTVVSHKGKEATVTLLGAKDFAGEEALTARAGRRLTTATALTACTALRVEKAEFARTVREEPAFAGFFLAFLLARSMRTGAGLVDQLFNSSVCGPLHDDTCRGLYGLKSQRVCARGRGPVGCWLRCRSGKAEELMGGLSVPEAPAASDNRPLLIGASCAALATLVPVALYQLGVVSELSDPPLRVFDSERITMSKTAHPLGVPDSLLGLASFGTRLTLAIFARRNKTIKKLLGMKLVVDASAAAFNDGHQVIEFRKLCSWCTATAVSAGVMTYAGRGSVRDVLVECMSAPKGHRRNNPKAQSITD